MIRSLHFREETLPENRARVGLVMTFAHSYLLIVIGERVGALNLNNFKVEAQVLVKDLQHLSRKEFDSLISALPGNTTMTDWSFSEFEHVARY